MATSEKDNELLLQKNELLLQKIGGIISEYDKGNIEPESLRDALKKALNPRKENVKVKERRLEIARKMLSHYMEIENKTTNIQITEYVNQLVKEYKEKYRNFDELTILVPISAMLSSY